MPAPILRIPSAKVVAALKQSGVTQFYHANSVLTACEFLRSGALISRGYAEANNLLQTPQASDDTDKEVGVWNDVFVDSVDIHHRARKKNDYGPVLLVFRLTLANTQTFLRVTKSNPWGWVGVKPRNRWFRSAKELREGLIFGEFSQMVVFRNGRRIVPMRRDLQQIILDDPKCLTLGKLDLYAIAYGALTAAMAAGRVKVPIIRRTCRPGCDCEAQYKEDAASRMAMFWPAPRAQKNPPRKITKGTQSITFRSC